jgi:putative ABC transport system permease protein
MAACIVFMVFVFYEKSFDGMAYPNIYRLDEVQKFEAMCTTKCCPLHVPDGAYIKTEFPEVLM